MQLSTVPIADPSIVRAWADVLPFRSMVVAAARLPLIPVEDWGGRVAAALCAGWPMAAAMACILRLSDSSVQHVGAALRGLPNESSSSIHAKASMISGRLLASVATEPVYTAPHDDFPNVFATIDASVAGVGDRSVVVTARVPINANHSLIVQLWRPAAQQGPEDLGKVYAVTELIARSATALFHGNASGIEWLTTRESEVLDLVMAGHTAIEIASMLHRSPHTVHDHLKSIHRKTGASTRGQLIAAATGQQPVDSSDLVTPGAALAATG